MKATYVQKGEILDYVNQTGKTIDAGEIVEFGGRIGIAGTTILAGEKGSLHMSGVFRVPKKDSEAIKEGDDVYYTEEGCSAAASDSNVRAGYAVKKAEANEKEVMVNLR